jgi:branched-chain amino acid transport system substrate-binding protein
VEQMFSHIAQLQRPPFHPKWQELAPLAAVAGWTRFRAAQDWVDRNAPLAASTPNGTPIAVGARASGPEDDPALFREFLEWRANRLKPQEQASRPRHER